MLAPSPSKKAGNIVSRTPTEETVGALRFISELGRSLLFTVHPKRVASRVAEALQNGVDAPVCVFVAELDNIGLVSAAHSRQGESEDSILRRARFEKWLAFMPPQIGYVEQEKKEFLIEGDHASEYVSPLHINGEIRGAIVVGFDGAGHADEHKTRLIDAATQLAAMSVNLSTHYGVALNDSINEAREEHRRFTEAVLDALPVSLYVVDRDYRIVTWNRTREDGTQGISRDLAIGRDVFDVLEKYPQGRHREEFERAFAPAGSNALQQTLADDGSTRHWMISKVR